jgi:hypothetical protein
MTNQEIRRAVLEVMNNQLKEARHEHEVRMHISQIEHALDDAGYQVEDEQVMQAVHYLKEARMLKRTQESKMIKTGGLRRGSSRNTIGTGSFKHTDYWYTLTQKAIDELEGETEYSKKPFAPLQNIQINTSNAPVIVGSNNNVSNNVTVFNQLEQLAQTITESEDISVEDRQDAANDIESLKQQLAKPNPNQTVVELLWKNIARVADIAGAGALAVEVVKGIAAITGHPIG